MSETKWNWPKQAPLKKKKKQSFTLPNISCRNVQFSEISWGWPPKAKCVHAYRDFLVSLRQLPCSKRGTPLGTRGSENAKWLPHIPHEKPSSQATQNSLLLLPRTAWVAGWNPATNFIFLLVVLSVHCLVFTTYLLSLKTNFQSPEASPWAQFSV